MIRCELGLGGCIGHQSDGVHQEVAHHRGAAERLGSVLGQTDMIDGVEQISPGRSTGGWWRDAGRE